MSTIIGIMIEKYERIKLTKFAFPKLVFLGLSFLCISLSVAATKPKSSEVLPFDWQVSKSNVLEISVSKLEISVKSPDKKIKTVCSGKKVVNFDFGNEFVLSLTCLDTYGGLVHLHNPNEIQPRSGIVVANDFGDEGCSEVTSSILEWSKDGRLTLKTSTSFSGKLAGGSESDCNPGFKQETFVFEKTKRLFEKSSSDSK